MSRILAVGIGPLLESGVRNFSAHALRTWHLVSPLIRAGHDVQLFTLPIMGDDPAEQQKPGVVERAHDGFTYRAFLNFDEAHNLRHLNEAAAAHPPDAILGINSYPCFIASQVCSTAPMWADFNGWLLVEAQVKSAVHGNNFMLGRYWRMEEAPLRRADKFSTVSMRQYYALLGELGAVGRLSRFTFNYPFAHFIPNAFNPFLADLSSTRVGTIRLRGEAMPVSAFAVLWSGGYNSWTNVEILYQALERAMRESAELHYVSTGGAIHGHDDLTYARFQSLVAAGPFRDRFHLLGWVPAEELPGLYAQCNLGLCVDADNYETMFGARNRTINMMAAGLPVLTTMGAEISEELVEAECALGCRVGDADDLARALIGANWRRDQLRQTAARGREYVLSNFSYEATTRELVAWAAHPAHAPDNSEKISRAGAEGDPFALSTNPIEARYAALEKSAPSAESPAGGLDQDIKTAARRIVGTGNWNRLRYAARTWRKESWPRYRQAAREAAAPEPPVLEELQISLNAPPGGPPGAHPMRLSEFINLGQSLPPLQTVAFIGGEIAAHPDAQGIVEALACPSRAALVRIRSNGMEPVKLQTLCINLIEESRIPGRIEVWIELDGDEAAHSAMHPQPHAWIHALHSLELLRALREAFPDRLDFGVVTTLADKNHAGAEELNRQLRRHPGCRHIFELPWSSEGGVWNLPAGAAAPVPPRAPLPPRESWGAIRSTLRRIQRETAYRDRGAFVTLEHALRMHAGSARTFSCISAGRKIALVYGDGALAMCGLSKAALNLRDCEWNLSAALKSKAAEEMRALLGSCSCTQPCHLARNLEATLPGQLAMLRVV